MFGGTRDYVAALKVATYGAIPVMLAGATLLLPVMAIVGLVGLCHTLFLFWLGARRVLNVPRGAEAEFVGISIMLLTFVSVLVGAAAERESALACVEEKGPHRCGPLVAAGGRGTYVPSVTIVSPVRFGYRTCSTSSCVSLSGAGVSRLTTMITRNPSGTPHRPAEIGWMPHHVLSAIGPVTPNRPRSQGWVVAM